MKNIHVWHAQDLKNPDFFKNNHTNKLFKLLWVEDDHDASCSQSLGRILNDAVDIYIATDFESALYLIDNNYMAFNAFILDINLKKHLFDNKNNPYIDSNRLLISYAEYFAKNLHSSHFNTLYQTDPIRSGGVWLWSYLMSKNQRKPTLFYSGNPDILGEAITNSFIAFGLIGFWSKSHDLSPAQLKHFMQTCRENLQGVPWHDIKSELFKTNPDVNKTFEVNGKSHSLQEFFPEHNLSNDTTSLEERSKWLPLYSQSTLLSEFFESDPIRKMTHPGEIDLETTVLQARVRLAELKGRLHPTTYDKIESIWKQDINQLREKITALKNSYRINILSEMDINDIKLSPRFGYADLDVLTTIIQNSRLQTKSGPVVYASNNQNCVLMLGEAGNQNLLEAILTRIQAQQGTFFKIHQDIQGYATVYIIQSNTGLCLNNCASLPEDKINLIISQFNLEDLPDIVNRFYLILDFAKISNYHL